ncbi:hypothetical protein V5R04_12010 [Jonesiaceae bacterium BS-20]|uniref:Uncharacterized protein n=1 Tax=Jonesiaceae bacterium BS-20 TaxID=3120821 RepID=A0AAU7DU10_9MICO
MWIALITAIILVIAGTTIFALRDLSAQRAEQPGTQTATEPVAQDPPKEMDTATSSPTPEPIPLDPGVVRGWGNNTLGELGDGTSSKRGGVVAAEGLTNVHSVFPIARSTFAVLTDGTVYGWGFNERGELGDGTTEGRTLPAPIEGLEDVVSIHGAWQSILALHQDGTISAWGYNQNGELGNGTTDPNPQPAKVPGVKDVKLLEVTGHGAVLAVLTDGTVMAWGSNITGQLGDGMTSDIHTPAPIQHLKSVQAIYSSGSAVYAVLMNGTVMSWGDASDGALGDRDSDFGYYPATISGLEDVSKVVAAQNAAFAILQDGTVMAWGSNKGGRLGTGTDIAHSDKPVAVKSVAGAVDLYLTDKANTVFVLLEDGTLIAWGANNNGQLGDGSTTNRSTPEAIAGVSGVKELWPISRATFALLEDGTMMVWGDKRDGKIGKAATGDPSLPVPFGDVENGEALFGSLKTAFVVLTEG